MKIRALLFINTLLLMMDTNAALLAGFDFQTTTTGGTAAVASTTSVSSPLVYTANFGTATLYLDGSNGASTFTTGVTNPEVTSFAGSSVNTVGTSFSTTTTGAASLAVANSTANGKRAVFVFSMEDFEGLGITYSTQATATGFNAQTWSYSLDGVTFTDFATYSPRPSTTATTFSGLGVVTLDTSALSVLDGEDSVYIGVTFAGSTTSGGNNRLDNIQFTAVPEPASLLLGSIGLLAILRRRR